jgi:hypothetical protein
MRISAKLWLPLLAALCLVGFSRAADADKLTPADAEVVVSINVRQLLDSELFKKYGKDEALKSLKDEKTQKLLSAVGLDPLKDVDSVLITAAGATAPKALIVAHGHFDVEKIRNAAEKYADGKPEELKITKSEGLTIYEGINADSKQSVFAHFVGDGKTLLASTDKAYLMQAIKSPSGGPSKQMQAAMSKLGGKESVWIAAVITDEMKKQIASNPQTKDLADKLEAVTGSIAIATDVTTSLIVHTTDAKSAGDVKKMLNQIKPLLTLMAQSNEQAGPVIGEIVDNLKITTDQNSVKITLKVTEEQIEKAGKPEAPKDK